MARIADTSFLLTLFDAQDPRRKAAKEWAAEADAIAIPPEVLGETLGVSHSRQGYAKAEEIFLWLAKMPHIELLDTTDVSRIAEIFRHAAGKLSWVDAAVVAWCRQLGGKPLCFDPDIEKAVRRR